MAITYDVVVCGGEWKVGGYRDDVDLSKLDDETRECATCFVSATSLPELKRNRSRDSSTTTYTIVEVFAEDLNERFDRIGFWVIADAGSRPARDRLDRVLGSTALPIYDRADHLCRIVAPEREHERL